MAKELGLRETTRKLIPHWIYIAALLMTFDVISINLAYGLALWLRFDCVFSAIPKIYLDAWIKYIPINTVCTIFVIFVLRLYRSIWRYVSYHELVRTTAAAAISIIMQVLGMSLLFGRMPVSYYIIGGLLEWAAISNIRFSYRFLRMLRNNLSGSGQDAITPCNRIMIIGAGEAGRMIITEIRFSNRIRDKVFCIIDDNENKRGRYIDNIPVVGTRRDILANIEKYAINQIIFAIPSATAAEKRDILNICKETTCELKSVPGIYQLINNEVTLNQLRHVSVEDLLGRDTIQVNLTEIFQYIQGKTVLVTGGGGSIGSELCRQIAQHEPKRLIIVDIYENNAYSIEQELKRQYPKLTLTVLVGSVRDESRIDQIFQSYRPDIVYHAAAHKHVPLMEGSPNEAIKNNVFGTYKTAKAADQYGVERFVLISTDKAVNPTNIMGASKRICEMIIQCLASHSKTEFVAVRFGNVLDSNGSVVPLFKKQIENGGPVTVTHPDIIRYFMTIPEAVSLVLQAGYYAKGGEIFVLDMGDPVRIQDLAVNLIKLSGLVPGVDIQIKYTGLRPGEKLFEEKLMDEEGLEKTANNMIHIGHPIEMDIDQFDNDLKQLAEICNRNSDEIRDFVSKLVPTYTRVN